MISPNVYFQISLEAFLSFRAVDQFYDSADMKGLSRRDRITLIKYEETKKNMKLFLHFKCSLILFRQNFPCVTALFQSSSLDEPSTFENYMALFQQVMKERADAKELYQAYR